MTRYALLLVLAIPSMCFAKWTPCASWPTNAAAVHLQNAGLVKIDQLDEAKTKAVPIASEKIGKDLYRQVFDITLYAKCNRPLLTV